MSPHTCTQPETAGVVTLATDLQPSLVMGFDDTGMRHQIKMRSSQQAGFANFESEQMNSSVLHVFGILAPKFRRC